MRRLGQEGARNNDNSETAENPKEILCFCGSRTLLERFLTPSKGVREASGVVWKLAGQGENIVDQISGSWPLGSLSGASLARFGAPAEDSWGHLGGLLGASWGPLGGLLGLLEAS